MKAKILTAAVLCLLACSCTGGGGSVQKAKYLTDSARQNAAGLALYQRGCWEKALAHFFRAHELAVAADLSEDTATSLNNIGNAYRMLGEAESAVAFLTEAAGIFRDAGDAAGVRQALCNLAAAQIALGRLDEAEKTLDRAEAVAAGGAFFAPLTVNRAVLLMKKKDYAGAEKLLLAALASAPAGDTAETAVIRHSLGVLLLETGRPKEALPHLTAALDADRAQGFAEGMAEDLFRLGQALKAAGDAAGAVTAWKRALLLFGLLNLDKKAEAVKKELAPAAAEAGVSLSVTDLFEERWKDGQAYESPCGR